MAKPTSDQMEKFQRLVNSGHITKKDFQAFLNQYRSTWTNDGIIEHELMYTPNIVNQLGDEGNYRGYRSGTLTDENLPTKGEDGVVRYRLISGEELKRADGLVYRSDVEVYFHDRGMRFPNAAEALLPPAKDQQLGRDDHMMVAFIAGSDTAFVVEVHNHGRSLNQDFGYDPRWPPNGVFLAVCK